MKDKIKVKCTGEYKPTRGSRGAAGIDLYNNGEMNEVIPYGGRVKIHTGCHFEIPKGYVGLLFIRSSIGTNRYVSLLNSVGVIDSDYRGEVQAVVTYTGPNKYATINKGERFAQLIIVPYSHLELEFVEELSDTDRGDGGFGSTGTK